MAKQVVSVTVSAQNQFTEWFSFRPSQYMPEGKHRAGLRIGNNTGFSATVTLQAKRPSEAASAAADIETYTIETLKTLEFAEAVDIRVGVKTGEYTSGTIPMSIEEV